jgi:hypothetical protein
MQFHARLARHALAHLVHRAELPRGVHVQQRERRPRRKERLAREMQHDRAVLADRVQHHRPLGLGDRLAQDVDAFGFEALQVVQGGHADQASRSGCGTRRQGPPVSRLR